MNRSINEAFEKGIKDDATPEYVIKQVCTDHKSSLNIKNVIKMHKIALETTQIIETLFY